MTPQQLEARRRADAIYADQSHPYWQGDPGATAEMEGHFATMHPEPVAMSESDSPSLRIPRVPLPEGSGTRPRAQRPAQRRPKPIERILGPHLSKGLGNAGKLLEVFSPGADIQDAMQASRSSVDALRHGDIGRGLVEAAWVPGSLMGVGLPGSARNVRQGAEELQEVWSSFAGHNPKPLPQRPFHEDYPHPPEGRKGEPLTRTIGGDYLGARFVAGRRTVGGSDVGLSDQDIEMVATELVDRIEPTSRRKLGGALGQFTKTTTNEGASRVIRYAAHLSPKERAIVFGHEVGHAIDEMVGQIDTTGLANELKQVYHDLATGMQGRTTWPGSDR
ncbi:MAG: hypothetical protein HQ495_01060 [Alphaproteobacteria bacterium]|nr:hypothetical protein [Alphaproteobacteria bacterium]